MSLVIIVAAAYAGIVAFMYLAQTWLVFPGASLPSRPLDGPLQPERLRIETPDGDTLYGLLFRTDPASKELLIGFGGNAQDAEMLAHDLISDFPDLNIAVFHYRGYGPSTGRPSEQALLADALLIHDALVEELRPERVYAIGISLGSAVAAYLSKERPLAGIILVTPFDSVEAIAKETYFWLPVGLLLRHRFRAIDYMALNPTPVAVIAAEQDRLVKPKRTAALVEQIQNLVFHRVIPGAEHNTVAELPIYAETLREALDALRRAVAEPAAIRQPATADVGMPGPARIDPKEAP